MGNCEQNCCEANQRYIEIESESISPEAYAQTYRNLITTKSKFEFANFRTQEKNVIRPVEKVTIEEPMKPTTVRIMPKQLSSSSQISLRTLSKTSVQGTSKQVFSKTDLKIVAERHSVSTLHSKSKILDESPPKASFADLKVSSQDFLKFSHFTFAKSGSNCEKSTPDKSVLSMLKDSYFRLKKSPKAHMYTNGDLYVGEWDKERKKHGNGIFVWKDGSKLACHWVDNQACGYGRYEGCDKSYYEGYWENSQANGFGEYGNCEKYVYKGEWKDDLQEGLGEEIWPNGGVFEGNFRQGQKHGFGKMTFHDGSYYLGNFHNNEIKGEGEFSTKNYTFTGTWENGALTGKVNFAWKNGHKFSGSLNPVSRKASGHFLDPENKKTSLVEVSYTELWRMAGHSAHESAE